METQERRILVVACFGHFMSHFNMLVFPALVLPLAGRLGLSVPQVLELSFWMYLLFGLTALPWGLAADRWGAKPFLILFFFGAGLCGLAAAWGVHSPPALALALAGVGLFSGIYHPAGLGLISKGVRRLSLGLGYNGMFGNLGLATAPLITGVVNWLWGPRGAYLLLGGLNLVGVGLMALLPLAEPRGEEAAASAGGDGQGGGFLILLVAMMLGGIVYRGSTVILPAYFELKNAGLLEVLSGLWPGELSGNVIATTLVSLIYLAGIAGQYTGGRAADRFEPRFSYLVFYLLTLPPVFLMAVTSNLPLVGLALVYFFFFLGTQPAENTLVARLTPRRLHHAAYGTKFVLTFGVGALAVKMVGVIEEVWSLEAIFPALGLVSLVLVGTILFLIRRTPALGPAAAPAG